MSLRRSESNDPFIYADYGKFKLYLKESELEFLKFKREKGKVSLYDTPDPRLGDYEA